MTCTYSYKFSVQTRLRIFEFETRKVVREENFQSFLNHKIIRKIYIDKLKNYLKRIKIKIGGKIDLRKDIRRNS